MKNVDAGYVLKVRLAQDCHPQKKAGLNQNILGICLGFTKGKMSKSNIIAAILLIVGLGCFFNPFSGII